MVSFEEPQESVKPAKPLWSRWWFLLGLAGLFVCVCPGGCIAGILGIVFGALKSSQPYAVALQQAQTNPQVIQRLGQPIVNGWWVTGNISVRNSEGNADITYPISGPKGTATIHTQAARFGGKWETTRTVVTFQDGTDVEVAHLPIP